MEEIKMTREALQELMGKVLQAGLGEMKKMNPLEEKKYNEELAKDKRRAQMVVALGRAEEEAMKQKRGRCSHSRWPAGTGKRSGESCPTGQGEWCTGGQKHGDMTVSIICQRCATEWRFKATPGEIDYGDNEGFLGFAPPPPERCVSPCNDCSQFFTPAEMKEHKCALKVA